MGDVAVSGDFVGRIHNDDASVGAVRQNARYLSEHGCLAHSGFAEEQNALAGQNKVFDDSNSPINGPAHAQSQSDYLSSPVSDGGYPMQSALNACSVILSELADEVDCVLNFVLSHFLLVQIDVFTKKTSFWKATQIQNHLQQLVDVFPLSKRLLNVGRKLGYQDIKL